MRLRSLEIQGFKSFPDKTFLEFDDGITAVVGPNGSGKSNIADAVRWVLGEQSTKNLRGAKMEDVIFGGTQTRKPVGYASVRLVIDNSDKSLPDQEDEIAITRKLYRSGESEYRIGAAQSRLKDIHELLMDTGLGRDGYSIIGQGKIAEIVSAKSRERREIFEEAAGIAKFRYRREEAEKRLAQAEENLVRLRDILDELESRVGPLRQQAEKAKEFLKLAEEKRGLEISLWMISLEDLKEKLAAQENRIDICKNEYQRMERESEGIEEKITAAFEQSQQLTVLVESKRGRIKEFEERLSGCEAEMAVRLNDIHHNNESIKRLEGELSATDVGVDELLTGLRDKIAARDQGERELVSMEGRIGASGDRLTEQKEQIERLAAELDRLNIQKESLERGMAEIRLEQAASDSAATESKNRLEALRKNTESHDSIVQEIKDAIEECGEQINRRSEAIRSLENARKGYALKRESRGAKLEELKARIQGMENTAGQKIQRARLLEDLENNMEGFAGSVKHILAQARNGALKGVRGVVSSLLSVREEYTVAIETVLGPALQNIVTDDEETAKRAIRMLQSAKSGRATFLPITTVKGRVMDIHEYEGQNGFVGVAASLVEYDREYDGIVSQLLGRIIVAEDLDCANRIARASGFKVRIVTLDGQVINAGGSFTGGSTSRSAGVLGRRNEIDTLRQEAEALRKQAAGLSTEQRALSAELSALDASISGTEAEHRTAQEEKVRLEANYESLRRDLSRAGENRELAEQELRSLTERLEKLRSGGESRAELLKEMEGQTAELQEKSAATKARRDTLVIGAETAAAAIGEQRMALLAARKDHESLEQEIARTQEQIDTAGSVTERLQSQKIELEQKNTAIENEIQDLEKEKARLREDVGLNNSDIVSIMERRTGLEGETTALRTKEREVSARREEVSRELVRLEERRHGVQAEYDGIITKLWDEYELTRSQARELAVEIPNNETAPRRLAEVKSKIRSLGTVNVEAIEEYTLVNERYLFLSEQVRDVESSKEQLLAMIGELTQEMRELFSDSFSKIAANFSKVFTQLFGGGKAELSLTDPEDVLEAGVDINVQPPGKVIKSLSLLSGGEQSFVAIAIYLAILIVKPAPFCLLDEIEAALDDVNVARFAAYLRQLCDKTQFIAITHRRGTMEEADVLYGVTMQEEGVSKLLELKVTELEAAPV